MTARYPTILRRRTAWLALSCVGALVFGCAAEGTGGLVFRVSGEEAARQGFPVVIGNDHDHSHDDDEVLEFADGWTLRWDAYVVSLGRLKLSTSQEETAIDDGQVFVVDLHKGDARLATFEDLGAKRWDRFGFSVTAPTGSYENVNADAAIVQDMADNGWNYWLAGTATRDDREISFAWGIANAVDAEDCTNGRDSTQGLIVSTNKLDEHEITLHVEHAFWTSLGSEIAEMRFDAIAAMADDDDFVSWEALQDQMLTDLRDHEGEPLRDSAGREVVYNPGSVELPRNDLQQFIRFATASQAHLNGGGLCTIRSRF